MIRAIYYGGMSDEITPAEIKLLSDIALNYVHIVIRELVTDGYLERVGSRKSSNNGYERAYRIVDRTKYRMEVMD